MAQESAQSLPSEDIPREGITLEFPYATIAAYERAVEVARKHPSFHQFGEGRAVRNRVTYSWRELAQLQEFKDAAWDLHQKRAYVNGVELRWEHMAQMTHCFYEKITRGKRDHCFFDGNFVSPFGCRYTLTNLADRINHEWLTYGSFDKEGVFHFDKPRIREHALDRVRRSSLHFCPAWDEEFLNVMVDVFPDQVNPDEDKRWRLMKTTKNQTIGVVSTGVDAAWKIVHELQEKVRQQRGPDKVAETGKLPVARIYWPKHAARGKKKSLLERILGK